MPDLIVLVGCDHNLQRKHPPQLPKSIDPEIIDEMARQRQHFEDDLRAVFKVAPFDLVGEEINHDADTIPRDLAAEHACLYANIDMPLKVRGQLEIPPDYVGATKKYSPEQLSGWHRQREQYMYDRVMEERATGTTTLVLCGSVHLIPMAAMFRRTGLEVRVEFDVTQKPWYTSDWSRWAEERFQKSWE